MTAVVAPVTGMLSLGSPGFPIWAWIPGLMSPKFRIELLNAVHVSLVANRWTLSGNSPDASLL
jgi:hypothetical protein